MGSMICRYPITRLNYHCRVWKLSTNVFSGYSSLYRWNDFHQLVVKFVFVWTMQLVYFVIISYLLSSCAASTKCFLSIKKMFALTSLTSLHRLYIEFWNTLCLYIITPCVYVSMNIITSYVCLLYMYSVHTHTHTILGMD